MQKYSALRYKDLEPWPEAIALMCRIKLQLPIRTKDVMGWSYWTQKAVQKYLWNVGLNRYSYLLQRRILRGIVPAKRPAILYCYIPYKNIKALKKAVKVKSHV